MNERASRLLSYMLARLNEGSTLRGLILILTAMGAKIEPDLAEAIVTGGLLLAGLLGILFPDQLRQGKTLRDAIKAEQEV